MFTALWSAPMFLSLSLSLSLSRPTAAAGKDRAALRVDDRVVDGPAVAHRPATRHASRDSSPSSTNRPLRVPTRSVRTGGIFRRSSGGSAPVRWARRRLPSAYPTEMETDMAPPRPPSRRAMTMDPTRAPSVTPTFLPEFGARAGRVVACPRMSFAGSSRWRSLGTASGTCSSCRCCAPSDR